LGQSRRRRSLLRERPLRKALWAALAVGVFSSGAVGLGWRAALAAVLALIAAGVTTLDDRSLARAGGVVHAWRQVRWLLLVLCLGLLPLPHALLALLAPNVAAHHHGWWTLGWLPSQTAVGIASWMLPLGMYVLAAQWARSEDRRSLAAGRMSIAALILLGVGLLHRVLGWDKYLGLWLARDSGIGTVVPFVNASHFGALAVMGAVFLVRRGMRAARREESIAVAWWLAAVALVALPVQAGSGSTVVAVFGVALVGALTSKMSLPAKGLGLAASLGLLGIGIWFALTAPEVWWHESVIKRVVQWGDGLRMIPDAWLSGVGLGNFGVVYPQYQSDPQWVRYDFLHQDLLQWVVETGMVGTIAVLIWLRSALLAFRGEGSRPWALASLGFVLVAMTDFPAQLPGVAMVFATVLAMGRFNESTSPSEPFAARRAAWIVAGVMALSSVVLLRADVIERTSSTVMKDQGGERLLTLLAPWAWELDIVAMRRDPAALSVAEDPTWAEGRPDAWLFAAGIALKNDRADLASELAERGTAIWPVDFRGWALRGAALGAQGDNLKAAEAYARAFRHMPWPNPYARDPLDDAWALLPVGPWWVDAMAPAGAWNFSLAKILVKEQEFDLALQAVEAGEKDLRIGNTISTWRVVIHRAAGEPEKAEAVGRAILEEVPDSVWTQTELANALLDQGKSEEALAFYLSAIDGGVHSSFAQVQALRAARELGGAAREMKLAEGFAARFDDLDTWLRLAQLRKNGSDLFGCRAALQRIRPNDRDARYEELLAACQEP